MRVPSFNGQGALAPRHPRRVLDSYASLQNLRRGLGAPERSLRSLPAFALAMFSVSFVACASPARSPTMPSTLDAERAITATLDDFHDAADKADEARYFAHFAKQGVFLGTDATERWDVTAFRAYAHPHFAKGKAWSMRATARHLTIGEGSAIAWFDEALETKNLGPARGSGVLVLEGGAWKIAQYNLAITVPNERFGEVKALLATPPK